MKSPKAAAIPLDNWIGYRFSIISVRLGEFVAQMYASRYDLSMPAWRSLAVIARHQPLTAKQLGMLTSSDAFKVARSIELLVRRGLIHRNVDKADRRRANLRLTADGRKIYNDIEKFVVKVESRLTATLSETERQTLGRVLDKLDHQLETQIRNGDWKDFLKK